MASVRVGVKASSAPEVPNANENKLAILLRPLHMLLSTQLSVQDKLGVVE